MKMMGSGDQPRLSSVNREIAYGYDEEIWLEPGAICPLLFQAARLSQLTDLVFTAREGWTVSSVVLNRRKLPGSLTEIFEDLRLHPPDTIRFDVRNVSDRRARLLAFLYVREVVDF